MNKYINYSVVIIIRIWLSIRCYKCNNFINIVVTLLFV